jgi:aerobic C4-dicarboxylate transport protein
MPAAGSGDGHAVAAPRAGAVAKHSHGPVTRQLWFWVLIGIVGGTIFGFVAPDLASQAKWLADGFIQLVKTVTGPVVFLTVVVGISALGDMARAGGLAIRALGYFFAMTVVALGLGLLAGNIFKPGAGFSGAPSESGREAAQERIAEAGEAEGETGGLTGPSSRTRS